jgi:hypothetical protein
VANTIDAKVGDHPVTGKLLVGHVDNSAFPAIDVDIQMQLVSGGHEGRCRMMMFGGRGLPGLAPPPPARPGDLVPQPQRRPWRSAGGVAPPPRAIPRHRAVDCRRLGLRLDQSGSIQADNGAGLTRASSVS